MQLYGLQCSKSKLKVSLSNANWGELNIKKKEKTERNLRPNKLEHLIFYVDTTDQVLFYFYHLIGQVIWYRMDKRRFNFFLSTKSNAIFKSKVGRNDTENYRPISNICSSSKIFEKLILKCILDLQVEHNVDLTGTNQHSFKKKRSTTSLSQTIIAQALEDDCQAL